MEVANQVGTPVTRSHYRYAERAALHDVANGDCAYATTSACAVCKRIGNELDLLLGELGEHREREHAFRAALRPRK